MNDKRLDEIIVRLARIEERLIRAESGQPSVAPPPFVIAEPSSLPRPPRESSPSFRTGKTDRTTRTAAPEPAVKADVALGRYALPWAGAALVLLGLGYLAYWAIGRGIITPPMQFAGALGLSIAFWFVGAWRESKDESFGGLLSGIGAAGSYLALAGGAQAFELYTDAVMIGLLLLHSLVAMLYGSLRSTRAFVVMGYVGSFTVAAIAATDSIELSGGIAMGTLMVATAIVWVRKWDAVMFGGAALWALAMVAHMFVAGGDGGLPPATVAIGTTLGAGLIMAYWALVSGSRWRFAGWLVPLVWGLAITMVVNQWLGALLVAGFAALIAALSAMARESEHRSFGARVWPMVLAGFLPLQYGTQREGFPAFDTRVAIAGFTEPMYPWMLSFLVAAIAVGVGLFVSRRGELLLLGSMQLVVSALIGMANVSQSEHVYYSPLFWGGVFGCSMLLGYHAIQNGVEHDAATVGLASAIGLNVAAWTFLLAQAFYALNIGSFAALTIAWSLYGFGALALGSRLDSANTRTYGLVLVLGTSLKLVLIDLVETELVIRIGLMLAIGVAALFTSYRLYLRPSVNR